MAMSHSKMAAYSMHFRLVDFRGFYAFIPHKIHGSPQLFSGPTGIRVDMGRRQGDIGLDVSWVEAELGLV
jgi:hypothetical protein